MLDHHEARPWADIGHGGRVSGPQLSFAECRPPLYSHGPISVREADALEVDWMIRRHYIGKWPGVPTAVLGYFRDDYPRGVLVFALPPIETAVRYGGPTWELARLWLEDEEPRNSESWFIARGVRYVRRFHRHVVSLVSYADPSAGHTGTIYRASNWHADGMTDEERTSPRFDYEANGRRYSRRSHVPADAEVTRIPRVSKYRFCLPLRKTRAVGPESVDPDLGVSGREGPPS